MMKRRMRTMSLSLREPVLVDSILAATGELAGHQNPVRQMVHQAPGGGPGFFFARETSGCSPLRVTEGTRPSQPGTLPKEHTGGGPSGSWTRCERVLCAESERRLGAEIRRRLETIHPNPGPGSVEEIDAGGRTRRGRRSMAGTREGRMGRRRARARERRGEDLEENAGDERQGRERGGGFKWVATWNVQRLSMTVNNRERLRRVVAKIEEEGWELVLLSEILEERGGVI